MTRTQRSLKNFLTSILLQVSTVGVGFVSTPLLLQWLGDERFGAFRSTSDWMGYLQLLEFGIGGALLPLLANTVAKADRQATQLTLAIGIRAYLKVVGLMCVVALLFGGLLRHLVPVQASLSNELQVGYWVGLAGLLWLPLSPFRILSDASQRSDLVNFSFIFQNLLINIAALYLAYRGAGIPGQFLAVSLGTLAAAMLLSWQGLRHYPTTLSTIFRPVSQSRSTIQSQLYQLSTPTLVLNLSGQLAFLTDNILIAYFISPASVVPFVLTRRLIGVVQSQLQGVGNSTWAALADLHAKGEQVQFNVRLLHLTRLVATAGLTLMIPIMIYNPQFVRLWVGAERFAGWGVNSLAAINAVLLGVLSLWGWCFSGTGNVAKIAPLTAISAVVNLLIGLAATPSLKLVGPLLGTLISSLIIQLWGMLYHLKHSFGSSRRALLGAIVRPFLLAMLYTPSAIWFAQSYPSKGWLELMVSIIATALLFLAFAWITLLEPKERYQLSQLKRSFLPKLSRTRGLTK